MSLFPKPGATRRGKRRHQTQLAVQRWAKRFAGEGSGHCFIPSDVDESDWRQWIHRRGLHWSGTAPRCPHHHGCFGLKYHYLADYDEHLTALLSSEANDSEEDHIAQLLKQCAQHQAARAHRLIHRNAASRKGSQAARSRH